MTNRYRIGVRSAKALSIALALGAPLAADAAIQKGRVESGGKPISGAQVTLYSAASEYGAPARMLGSAMTGAGGAFKIPFTSDSEESVLYLIAEGGTAKKDKLSGRDSVIKMATILGDSGASAHATVNERTTVASAYTMAQFLLGSDIAGPAPGVPNAANIFGNLVNTGSGAVGRVLNTKPNGKETETLDTFNSLANILAVCVQTQSQCDDLFELAVPPAGGMEPVLPTDTLQAILNIAHYPYENAAGLFLYASRNNTYKPNLGSGKNPAPAAWTLAIRYDGNGKEMDGPGFIAFDELGTAWIANNYNWKKGTRDNQGTVCGAKDVMRLTPTGEDAPGAPYTGGGANGAGFGIMIDKYGDVWQGNFGFAGKNCADKDEVLALSRSVSRYDGDGVPQSPDNMPGAPGGYPADGTIYGPQGMSSHPQSGNVWIANCRDNRILEEGVDGSPPTLKPRYTVTLLEGGDPASVQTFAPFIKVTDEQKFDPKFLPKPFGMTVTPDGRGWVAGNNINQVAGINPNDAQDVIVVGNKFDEDNLETDPEDIDESLRLINRPMGIASDSQGGVWVANSGLVDIACGYRIDPSDASGNTIEGEDTTFTSMQDNGVLDEDGNAADYDGALGSITWIEKNGDPNTINESDTYDVAQFKAGAVMPWGIALDGNDNVWIANFDGQRVSLLCGRNPLTCPPGYQETGTPISPDQGYYFSGLVRNTGVSIDPSGNVWLTNNWLLDPIQTNPGGREVVLFLGLAKPVTTPMVGYPAND